MPDVNELLNKTSRKKFKKSSYRPWNYMEEIQKEEREKHQRQEITGKKCSGNEPSRPADREALSRSAPQAANVSTQAHHLTKDQKEKIEEHRKQNNEQAASLLYSILRLSGYQKIIFTFILERCLSRGLLSSGMVTKEILMTMTNTSLGMVNTSIQRLVDKNLVSRKNGKRGRGGFYNFGMNQIVKDAAIESRRLTILENPEVSRANEVPIDEMSKVDTRRLSGLPKDWEEVDIEPLYPIGFSRGHLVQLYKQGNMDTQTIQDSIYHFAYDLKYNNKAMSITKSGPIGYFMGILKRSSVYTAPGNYESPKDRALRELLEHKKAEKEKRDAMVKELIRIAFEEWQAQLSPGEKDRLLPEEIKRSRLTGAKLASLKAYFVENIWPNLAPKEMDV